MPLRASTTTTPPPTTALLPASAPAETPSPAPAPAPGRRSPASTDRDDHRPTDDDHRPTGADHRPTGADRRPTDGDGDPDRAALAAQLRRRERARQQQLDSLPPFDTDPVARAYRDSVTRALESVRAALAQLEAGRYGECRGCLAQIPAARLAAAPSATLCVACAVAVRTQ